MWFLENDGNAKSPSPSKKSCSKKWLNNRTSSFWSVLQWLPYHILFIFIIASLFPVTNPANEGGPSDGIIILGLLFFYPFIVFVLNAFSVYSSAPENK